MNPQLTKFAECLSESHAREIKLARCLAESLKRIQTIEAAVKTDDKKTKPIEARLNAAIQVVADKVTKNSEASLIELKSIKADANTKAKSTELRFNAAMRELSEHYAKRTAENEELIRQMEDAIKVDFPAQIAALKTEFATPAAQAAAPQSFNPRGAYEPGEKYKPFDYVSSNGSSYIALVENPTQPPSKKSKQWMLVAARGAGGGDSGGGGVTGLGTAAYVDVGQAGGNVLQLSYNGEASLGDNNGAEGVLKLYDNVLNDYSAVRSVNGSLQINTNPLALTSQLPTFGTGVAAALAVNVGSAGAPLVNGGALGTPSSGTVTNLNGTASININGTVGATTPTTGAFTTLNASGLTRVGTATTADALSDVLIATSATTQRGLTIQGKASQSAPLLRIVESTNNAANNGWQFEANAVSWSGSGIAGGYLNSVLMITQPGFYYKWNSSTTNVFSAATFSLGPTVAGSKILAVGNGTQFDTSGGISCAQIILDKTITAVGTTGAQTINKSSGAVNFAAAATSLVVTNSFCTVNSVIQCTVGTNDTTLKSVAVVAAAGSFTMHANAAATAETRVFFSITN